MGFVFLQNGAKLGPRIKGNAFLGREDLDDMQELDYFAI